MSVEGEGIPEEQLNFGLVDSVSSNIPEGQLGLRFSVMDKLRMISLEFGRYSVNGLGLIAPAYLTEPAEIVGFVAEYTNAINDLAAKEEKDEAYAIAVARANIGYFLGDYPYETEELWKEALAGAGGLLTGPFAAAAFMSGVTVINFEDHEDLAVKLRLRGGLRNWAKGVKGVETSEG